MNDLNTDLAWRLEVNFDSKHHLFHNKIKTDYIVVVFICCCGSNKFITASKYQNINYCCEECENDIFYNSSELFLSVQHFLFTYKDIELTYDTSLQYCEDNTMVSYYTKVPYDIDFLNEEVIYKKLAFYSYTLNNNGELSENYLNNYDEKIFNGLSDRLVEFISLNPNYYNIPKPNKKINYSINMASFFIKYPYFKEFDFYYWEDAVLFYEKDITIAKALDTVMNNRKEKSIKKAINQNYLEQLSNGNIYYNTVISLFTKLIKDPNLVVKYIRLYICSIRFSTVDTTNISSLIPFLQQNYSDKQILNMLDSIKTQRDENLFIDLLNNYSYIVNLIGEFIKVKCNMTDLHDEFVRISSSIYHKEIYNKDLIYTKQEKSYQKEIEQYRVLLPHNGKELLNWAETLHNCLAGYFTFIENNQTLIFGFYKDGIIDFAVEIRDTKIIQASSKYNHLLNDKQNLILKRWYKSCFEKIDG